MGCVPEYTKHGKVLWCGKGIEPCLICGHVADYLCDYPVGEGNTCDLPLCVNCAKIAGDDIDLCPMHYEQIVAAKDNWLKNVRRFKGELMREQKEQIGIPRRLRKSKK